jgi:hypothetical protein
VLIELIRIGKTGIYRLPADLVFNKNCSIYVDSKPSLDAVIISENEVDVTNVDDNTTVEVEL